MMNKANQSTTQNTTQVDWKKLTSKMSEFHREFGASIISRDSEPLTSGSLLNLTKEKDMYSQEGSDITPKKVRRWLWEMRDKRSMKREGLVLWSAYDEDKNTSCVGFGVLVDDKIVARFPPTHVVGAGE
jgi:hypothetical protein